MLLVVVVVTAVSTASGIVIRRSWLHTNASTIGEELLHIVYTINGGHESSNCCIVNVIHHGGGNDDDDETMQIVLF